MTWLEAFRLVHLLVLQGLIATLTLAPPARPRPVLGAVWAAIAASTALTLLVRLVMA